MKSVIFALAFTSLTYGLVQSVSLEKKNEVKSKSFSWLKPQVIQLVALSDQTKTSTVKF